MVVKCVINGCPLRPAKNLGVGFFSIPAVIWNQCDKTRELSIRRRRLWLARINRKSFQEDDVKPHTKVCGKHFISGRPSALFDDQSPDWAPTLDLGYDFPEEKFVGRRSRILQQDLLRQRGILRDSPQRKKFKKITEDTSDSAIKSDDECRDEVLPFMFVSAQIVEPNEMEDSEVVEPSEQEDCEIVSDSDPTELPSCERTAVSVQTELSGSNLDNRDAEIVTLKESLSTLEKKLATCEEKCKVLSEGQKQLQHQEKELQEQISNLTADNEARSMDIDNLRENLSMFVLDERSLEGKDDKVKFYTGLPSYSFFIHMLNLVKVNVSSKCSLSKFQEFLVVLMRLRLGLLEEDLAFRFGVHQSTISRICGRWLAPMSSSLAEFLQWPDRETLCKTMPLIFQENFGRSVVIVVEVLEVLIVGSSSSQSQPHSTVKYVIGITLQGSVSFVSEALDDHTSVKQVVENSGLLQKLLPGDIVISRKGFGIGDSVDFGGAKVVVSVSDGNPELSSEDFDLPRDFSNIPMHVERALDSIRHKFRILRTPLPVEFMIENAEADDEFTPIDHIVRVCCALTNLCSALVPME